MVIFSAQTRPNTTLLKEKVALYEDETVIVNEYLQTSDPDIYAIGDIVPVSFDKNKRHLFLPLVTRAVSFNSLAHFIEICITNIPIN
ncbi:hypothetical protein EfmAA610_22410 [Enterococcus faecium]|nr:hypothetical protein EfmAA610_22410 [Enterococcus faecium]